jgi:hypothetical protein
MALYTSPECPYLLTILQVGLLSLALQQGLKGRAVSVEATNVEVKTKVIEGRGQRGKCSLWRSKEWKTYDAKTLRIGECI